jgi:hypothetical protein
MSVLSLSCVYADNKTCAGDKMDFARLVFVAAFQSEEATPETHSLHPCLLNSCCCNIKLTMATVWIHKELQQNSFQLQFVIQHEKL